MILTGVLIGHDRRLPRRQGTDYWIGRVTDFLLSFPQQLFFIAFMPVVTALFVDPAGRDPHLSPGAWRS